uniref:Transposon Ty3-I Gag-Pol polyprotein n=1 Tax=Cajanus cajan TaxID=3821 RepID=A0A151TC39_CAJCA|nr:Transposon Ty3-I Gag-Pol polyprotein [Cajanus cajan]
MGSQLRKTDSNRVKCVVRDNRDLFAWTASYMPGIDPKFLCHRLAVCRDARPVAQKKRKMGDEKRKAANAEVKKLLQARFIREVTYTTWLANVVLVRKSNGKWRMCTDLNKACPKDAYPLPCIDRLVDGASGHSIFSFLDAYSGYNQIRMHPSDEEKMAFITENANFCYQVMPFGLKNAGATYQRLMDRVFREQIG